MFLFLLLPTLHLVTQLAPTTGALTLRSKPQDSGAWAGAYGLIVRSPGLPPPPLRVRSANVPSPPDPAESARRVYAQYARARASSFSSPRHPQPLEHGKTYLYAVLTRTRLPEDAPDDIRALAQATGFNHVMVAAVRRVGGSSDGGELDAKKAAAAAAAAGGEGSREKAPGASVMMHDYGTSIPGGTMHSRSRPWFHVPATVGRDLILYVGATEQSDAELQDFGQTWLAKESTSEPEPSCIDHTNALIAHSVGAERLEQVLASATPEIRAFFAWHPGQTEFASLHGEKLLAES